MRSRYLLPLPALLLLASCEVPSPAQRRALDAMIGHSETDLLRTYGVPSRTITSNGHTFLAYVQNDSSYSPGTPGFGWGWGGWGGPGYGGFGFGGFGGYGGYGGYGGFGGFGGFPPTYYEAYCTTTFEIVNNRVASWNLRGSGC